MEEHPPQPRTSVVTAVGFLPASHHSSVTQVEHSVVPGTSKRTNSRTRSRLNMVESSSDVDAHPPYRTSVIAAGARDYPKPWRRTQHGQFKQASIPVFSYPAHKWAAAVRRILQLSEININEHGIQREVLPVLYSRLPAEVQAGMSDVLCIGTLLEHVEKFDSQPASLARVLKKTHLHDALPSTELNVVEEELRKAFPSGMDRRALRSLAWSSIKERLLPPLSTFVQFSDINDYPTRSQLNKLDELHLQGERHVVASAQSERLDKIEASLDKLINLQLRVLEHQESQEVAAAYTQAMRVNGSSSNNSTNVRRIAVPRTPGGTGDRRGGTHVGFDDRAGPAAGGGRLRPCRFHAQFGNQARNCEAPCLFAALLGGLRNGLSSLTEEARQQLRLGADSDNTWALPSSSGTLAIEAPK